MKDEFHAFCFAVRYKYAILRSLDLLRECKVPYEPRMEPALEAVRQARRATGRWRLASQSGRTYGKLEDNPKESRWNTLRALRVLACYGEG